MTKLTPPKRLEAYQLITRITWPDSRADQAACMAELTRRGLWLSDAQAIQAERQAAALPPLDPRDPDPAKPGIFRDHNCWKCKDGAQPCVRGAPGRCDYPHARND